MFPVAVFSGLVRTEYHAAYAYVCESNAGAKALYDAAGNWEHVFSAKRKLRRTMGLSEAGVEGGICEAFRRYFRHDVFFPKQWIMRLFGSDKDGWQAQMRTFGSQTWEKLPAIDAEVA